MDKRAILNFRDFLRELKSSQFDNSVGITGPVPTVEQFLELDFSDKIQAGTAEWFALSTGDYDCTDWDNASQEWFWLSDDKRDYAAFCAENLDLYNERILRLLFAPDAQRSEVLEILSLLLIHDSEDSVWEVLKRR